VQVLVLCEREVTVVLHAVDVAVRYELQHSEEKTASGEYHGARMDEPMTDECVSPNMFANFRVTVLGLGKVVTLQRVVTDEMSDEEPEQHHKK